MSGSRLKWRSLRLPMKIDETAGAETG